MILSRVRKIQNIFVKSDFVILTLTLIVYVSFPIFMEKRTDMSLFVLEVFTSVIIAAGASVLFSSSRTKLDGLSVILGIVVLLLSIIKIFITASGTFAHIIDGLVSLFFLILTARLVRLILRQKKVNFKVVVLAIAGYILIGISGAIVLYLLSFYHTNAFDFIQGHKGMNFDYVYFSFVTMSTLGYGDLLPVTAAGKSLAILMMLSGVFYTTIVMGTIIGKFVSNDMALREEEEKEKEKEE